MNACVSLVVPPFLSIIRPSLGVSALKAALLQAGYITEIYYLNMDFAELIGTELNEWISESADSEWLLGDWIFAVDLSWSESSQRDDEYIRRYLGPLPSSLKRTLVEVRDKVRPFVQMAADRLLADSPMVVGFTTSFQQTCAALAIAREVKLRAPSTTICFGGANCEGEMGSALLGAFPQIDQVFSGEADITFPAFVSHLAARATSAAEKAVPADWQRVRCGQNQEVDGLATSNSDLAFELPGVPKPISGRVSDLDALPIPDFSDYFRDLSRMSYQSSVNPGLLFEGSRGCWWGEKHHCTFCGLNGTNMAYRMKSPERVLAELAELHSRWQINRFEAVDNILPLRYIQGVFDVLGTRQAPYSLFYEVKANLKHEQVVSLARGGVTWIQPGIESLDDDILALMDKGVRALQNIRLLRSCAETGVRAAWNIIYGFPGERAAAYERMASLVPYLEHLQPPQRLCRLSLNRFSPYFDRTCEPGFDNVRPVPAYDLVYNLPSHVVHGLAYYFEGCPQDIPRHDYISPLHEELSRWQRVYKTKRPVLMLASLAQGVFAPPGQGGIVIDTRSISRQTMQCIDPVEKALLCAFQDPVSIEAGIATAATSLTACHDPRPMFDRLVSLGYIIVDKNRALTLVTQVGSHVHALNGRRPFPGGWLTETQGHLRSYS